MKVGSDGSQKEVAVSKLPAIIGRDEAARLRIPVASVSRRHCELLESDDELVVRDLGSSNGTYVNGERVKSHELAPGDLLAVGPAVFVVRIDGFPKEIDAADSYAAGAVAVRGGDAAGGHAGVPSWGGAADAGPKTAVMGGGATGAGGGGAKGPAKKKDDDDLDSLLKDFDFSDLDDDDDEPVPKKK
ncbi:MAG: FHA domain-containing protein [Phycisphaerales bacterium]|nr:FHA domain-containing protein [Phycisphaerales bacterium]